MERNITWIDQDENDLGEVSLEKAHQEGLLHRIAAVYLTDDQDRILVQKRDDGWLDHSVGGHVEVGETYEQAAVRELSEEIGVEGVELSPVGDCVSNEFGGKIRHKFKVYRCQANPGRLQPEEVLEVFWADPQDVWENMKSDVGDKKYTGGFKETLKLLLAK